ncbi:hypothetical protein cypCar_00040320 [Cyprinus carpio]|nr:hypothetical protein cypCar_00040320 [Cyprinus carpio]
MLLLLIGHSVRIVQGGSTTYVCSFRLLSRLTRNCHVQYFSSTFITWGLEPVEPSGTQRIGVPKTKVNALARKSPRGSIRWIRQGSLLFTKWMDT